MKEYEYAFNYNYTRYDVILIGICIIYVNLVHHIHGLSADLYPGTARDPDDVYDPACRICSRNAVSCLAFCISTQRGGASLWAPRARVVGE